MKHSGIESRWGEIFRPSRSALGPTQPPVQWISGVKYGRGVLLTTHPLLVPQSWKSRAITVPNLWATTGPVTGTLFTVYTVPDTVHCLMFSWRYQRLLANSISWYEHRSGRRRHVLYYVYTNWTRIAFSDSSPYIDKAPFRPRFPRNSLDFFLGGGGFKSSVPVPCKIGFRKSNAPCFSNSKRKIFLKMRTKILTFPKWEKTSTAFGQPSAGH